MGHYHKSLKRLYSTQCKQYSVPCHYKFLLKIKPKINYCLGVLQIVGRNCYRIASCMTEVTKWLVTLTNSRYKLLPHSFMHDRGAKVVGHIDK